MAQTFLNLAQGVTGTLPNANYSGGKLLQIVTAEDTTELDLSSETFTDVGLSASITPSATSSKVLVFWNIHGRIMASANGFGSRLVRGSTNIWSTVRPYYIYGDYTNERHAPMFNYLDSPSTTSATTYKIQVNTASNKNVLFNANDIPSNITLMEIAS